MASITAIRAREVLDSRGRPTVEVEVHCGEVTGRAIVPSGASTGSAEALELRDGDSTRYDGLGVRRAVQNVTETIGPMLVGFDASDQAAIDARLIELDPTPRKSQLGGNALLGVSLAVAHAGAAARGVPLYQHLHDLLFAAAQRVGEQGNVQPPRLPLPMTNMISGGLHAGGNLDIQDVLVMPVGASDYATGLEWIVRVYRRLGRLLDQAGYEGRLVGDEGGFGPRLTSNREAIRFVVRAIEAAELLPGDDMAIAIDVAASHFCRDGGYELTSERGRRLSSVEMIDELVAWVDEFPIRSIEDGLAEDDWEGWRLLTERLGDRVWLIGDDLFATNRARVERGVQSRVANGVLVKVNQIGTLTETLDTILTARRANYRFVVSARSGESEDTTIADLAVAVAADSIKIGSIVRSERLAKYNQLLRLAERLD